MEKDFTNGMKMNIIKENIKMELKKEKEKLNLRMVKNLFVLLLMENLMELVFMKMKKEKEKKLNLLMEKLIRIIRKKIIIWINLFFFVLFYEYLF